MKRGTAHQSAVDCLQTEQREKLAYHHILTAIVTGAGRWGNLQRVGSAYDRGDSWTWQIAYSPRMKDAVILETFDSAMNGGKSVRCFYLDDARKHYAGVNFDSQSSEAKIQALYFHAVEMWRIELNRAA